MADNIKKIEKAFEELFSLLDIQSSFDIKESEEALNVTLDTNEAGIIIGYHGDTLEALELIMGFIAGKILGQPTRVYLEVGEYKKEREEYLKNLAEQIKNQVLSTGEAVPLPNLKAWERKYLHNYFNDDKEVTTQSDGEGKERTLSILPK